MTNEEIENVISELKAKETEILADLRTIFLFTRWEALVTTIKMFEGMLEKNEE